MQGLLVLCLIYLLMNVREGDLQYYEGDPCTHSGSAGVCCPLTSCSSAYFDLQNGQPPTPCSFSGFIPIVCCLATCQSAITLPPLDHDVGSAEPATDKRKSELMCEEYHQHVSKRSVDYYYYKDGSTTTPRDTSDHDPSWTGLPSADSTETPDHKTTTPGNVYSAVGGVDALISEFPHMAALGWPLLIGGFTFKCGGSLISDKFVLTAGHCLSLGRDTSLASTEPTIVRLGDQNILDHVSDGATPEDYSILRIIRHPDYKPPVKYYDIALLELQESVVFSNHIRPACLWTKTDFEKYTYATVTGWGTIVSGGRDNSAVLQKVQLDILEMNVCQPLLYGSHNRNWKGFRDNQMCAGVLQGGKDACQGDSGGPLQVRENDLFGPKKYFIIGVTSFGRECAKPNLPGVYTRVSAFIDWIEPIVWP